MTNDMKSVRYGYDLPKKADWNKDSASYGRGKSELRLSPSLLTTVHLSISNETYVVTVPDRVGSNSYHDPNQQTQERQAHLPKAELMVLLEHNFKGAEEQVQDP